MKTVQGRDRICEVCADLLSDESNMSGAWCDLAAWPEDTEEAGSFIGECSSKGIPVTVSGGMTGIAGGALPEGGAVLSTSLMDRLEMLENGNIIAGAGVTVSRIESFLDSMSPGYFYPPDPTEDTASVGGTIATDASGADSYLYGSTRKWVQGIQVVLASGEVLDIQRGDHVFRDLECRHPVLGTITIPSLRTRQPPKNAAGYYIDPGMDLIDLFIGSEGTLGVITRAELKLMRKPEHLMELAVFPGSAASFWDLYGRLLSPPEGLRIRALEMMDRRCMDFLERHSEGFPEPPRDAEFALLLKAEADSGEHLDETLVTLDEVLTGSGVDPDSMWGGFEPSEIERINDFRHALPESVNRRIAELRRDHGAIHKFGSDGAVDPMKLMDYYGSIMGILEDRGLSNVIFGHAGQGHLHANALPENVEQMELAQEAMFEIARTSVEMGGTVSAEHGLGKLKLEYLGLMYTEEELEGMRRIRRVMDPYGVLEPCIRF